MENYNFTHGGNIQEVARLFDFKKKGIIDFSANINPLGLPSYAKRIIRNNIVNILHYPDSKCSDFKTSLLKDLISNGRSVRKDSLITSNDKTLNHKNIIVGNGSIELIYLTVYTLNPKSALIVSPTFCEYERALSNVKSKIEYIELNEKNDFDISIIEIFKRLKKNKYDIIFLCNPNNPTGRIIFRNDLISILKELHDSNTILVLDEAFIDLAKEHSLIDIASNTDNLFVLRSFTKFFSLPGLRLGYGIGTERLIKKLEAFKQPWSVNIFAQALGSQFILDDEFINKTKNLLLKEMNFLYNKLNKIKGIKPFYSYANFILSKIQYSITSDELQARLLKKGILIRNCSTFKGLNNKYIRVAVRNRSENLKLVKRLSSILTDL